VHREVIRVGGDFDKSRPYSSGVITSGRTLYTSGLTATDGDGNIVGAGDMVAQVDQIFGRLKAILDEVDADFGDIVKFNVFVSDMDEYFKAKVSSRFYIDHPASCLIEVKGFANDAILVEIEAIVALK
jgi:enamine deaminase RidA (YjgF/YER057c/UK114 family)